MHLYVLQKPLYMVVPLYITGQASLMGKELFHQMECLRGLVGGESQIASMLKADCSFDGAI